MSYLFAGMIAASFFFSLCTGSLGMMGTLLMDSAGEAIELLLSISGMLCMWSGFMRVAQDCGLIEKLSRLVAPILRRLYPDVDSDSKAFHYISMNLSANLLGLGNAATPMGLNAMKELKSHHIGEKASDSMVTFVLMNTASIQLIPTTVAALRKNYGSREPFDILVCVWLTSITALAVGLFSSKLFGRWSQRTR